MEIDKLTGLPKAQLEALFAQSAADLAAGQSYPANTPEEKARIRQLINDHVTAIQAQRERTL